MNDKIAAQALKSGFKVEYAKPKESFLPRNCSDDYEDYKNEEIDALKSK